MRPGDRVELHPATDAWMQGDRFGTVVQVHPSAGPVENVLVGLDKSGNLRWFSVRNVT